VTSRKGPLDQVTVFPPPSFQIHSGLSCSRSSTVPLPFPLLKLCPLKSSSTFPCRPAQHGNTKSFDPKPFFGPVVASLYLSFLESFSHLARRSLPTSAMLPSSVILTLPPSLNQEALGCRAAQPEFLRLGLAFPGLAVLGSWFSFRSGLVTVTCASFFFRS